jgi:isoquinoline 1-oxidoreductase beta subunit
MTEITRRTFMKASLSSAGGLLIGFSLPTFGTSKPYQASTSEGVQLNAWLSIEPDDSILIRVARAEMGQGVMTSLPMFIAEELEADWRKIKVEYAMVDRQILEGSFGNMATRDSNSVSSSREMLQLAGAQARERLIKAAAETWVIDASQCYADYGRIHRQGSPDSFSYGELAELASQVSVANVKIKHPDYFNVVGLSTKRLDVPSKVDGSAVYSMDVRVPEMVYASVVHGPVFGGKLRSLRFNAIRHMPGVLKAIRMEGGVAVVAETFWQAKSAADKLPVFWDNRGAEKIYSDTLKKEFFDEFSRPGKMLSERGDIVDLMDHTEKTIESDYFVPYVCQAPLEPMNCTVHVQDDRVDVWVGHQDPEAVVEVVARVTGKAAINVYVHNCYLGGGFGRRNHTDFVEEAAKIALEIDRPVQMIWTREEDMRSGSYRPMSAMRFKAGFDLDNNLVAMTNHSVTHSIKHDLAGRPAGSNQVDENSIAGLVDHPYDLPAYAFSHTRKNTFLSSGWCRSGGHSINAYAIECFVDEMAAAAQVDPLDYRRQMLRSKHNYLDVLDVLKQESGWGKTRLPRGTAQGMAIHECYGTICGQVAQVTVESSGSVRVDKITAVLDSGNLVNPLSAEEQVEGAILFGLTTALYGKLTIENGKILEDNFDTYEIVRMAEVPEINIHWSLSGGEHWGGLGEPATPVVAPAICNALYNITGRRIRSLPVRDYYLTIR